jgi:hypothetical protein
VARLEVLLDRLCEAGVRCIYVDFCIIWQRSKRLVQRLVHLLWRPFKEPSASANKKRITSKDGTLITILKEVADAVLSMTRCVQRLHLDAFTDAKRRTISRRLGDLVAVLAANNREIVVLELWMLH